MFCFIDLLDLYVNKNMLLLHYNPKNQTFIF